MPLRHFLKLFALVLMAVSISACGSSTPVAFRAVSPAKLASAARPWAVPLLNGRTTRPSQVIINPLTTEPHSIYAALLRNGLTNPSMGISSTWHGLTVPAMWITDGRTTFNIPMYRGLTSNPSLNTRVAVTPARVRSLLGGIMRSHYLLLAPASYTLLIQRIPARTAVLLSAQASSLIENLGIGSYRPAYLVLWVGSSSPPVSQARH